MEYNNNTVEYYSTHAINWPPGHRTGNILLQKNPPLSQYYLVGSIVCAEVVITMFTTALEGSVGHSGQQRWRLVVVGLCLPS